MNIWDVIERGDIEAFRRLTSVNPQILNEISPSGHTALSLSIECDDIALVKTICEKGVDVNLPVKAISRVSKKTVVSRCPLTFSKSGEMLSYLHAQGADLSLLDSRGVSVFFYIGRSYKVDLLEMLVSFGFKAPDDEVNMLLELVSDELSFRIEENQEIDSERVNLLKEMMEWCQGKNREP